MNLEVAEKRLKRAQAKIQTLEKLIEDKSRELFLAQEEVQITNEYLQNILKSMLTALIVADAQGCIKTANKATLELLGYQVEELIGKSLLEICPGNDSFKVSEPEDFIRAGALVRIETNYRTKDGRGHWFSDT